MTMQGGIHIESELKEYREKAKKWEKVLALAKEENEARKRIKEIGQERAKLFGFTHKYHGDKDFKDS